MKRLQEGIPVFRKMIYLKGFQISHQQSSTDWHWGIQPLFTSMKYWCRGKIAY